MEKIKWCCLQKDGIKIIESNENISKKFIEEADSDLIEMKNAGSLKWKDIEAYYSCYNSVYALFQRIGIKCEIHDCTIELLSIISEKLGLTKKQIDLIKELKTKRTDVQYYLKKPEEIDERIVADFVLSCKQSLNNLTYDDIIKIRGEINKIIKTSKNEASNKKNK